MSKRIIIHIDFDSFFASVEQQENPFFRNKPLGVTAQNGRNCIIAASREAKKLGIKSPSRVHEAVQICPSLLLTGADFHKYFQISKQFLSICKDYSPTVEMFSIDEVFIDLTQTYKLFGGVEETVRLIKRRIRREIGEYITVSIGISHNKLLAKLASGLRKPDGMYHISGENIVQVYTTAQLTDVCGIGYRLKERLNSIGIYNLVQLQTVPLAKLIAEFGTVEGEFLKSVGMGIDDSPVIPYTKEPSVKSVGRNYCLPHNEYNQRIILQNIYELCEEIGIKLRRLKKKARTVGLSLRGEDSFGSRKTSYRVMDSGAQLFSICNMLYKEWNPSLTSKMVRMLSIWATNLIDTHYTPLSLFEREQKNERLIHIIDAINERYGDHTIRNGFLLYSDKLTTVPNGYGADTWDRTHLARQAQRQLI